MVWHGVLPGPQEDGRPGLVAVQPAAVDRVAARDAVLEDEEERGGEAVPTGVLFNGHLEFWERFRNSSSGKQEV